MSETETSSVNPISSQELSFSKEKPISDEIHQFLDDPNPMPKTFDWNEGPEKKIDLSPIDPTKILEGLFAENGGVPATVLGTHSKDGKTFSMVGFERDGKRYVVAFDTPSEPQVK